MASASQKIMGMLEEQQSLLDVSCTLNRMIRQELHEADFDGLCMDQRADTQNCYSQDSERATCVHKTMMQSAIDKYIGWKHADVLDNNVPDAIGSSVMMQMAPLEQLMQMCPEAIDANGELMQMCPEAIDANGATRPHTPRHTTILNHDEQMLHSFSAHSNMTSVSSLIVPLLGRSRRSSLDPLGGDRIEFMFPKLDDLREAVDMALDKTRYDVEELYSKTGCSQAVARHPLFHNIAMLVVVLNTVWIGVEVDIDEASYFAFCVNNAFCCFFTFEICIRLGAFAHKRNAFTDKWFLFEFLLWLLLVWDVWLVGLLDFGSNFLPSTGTGLLRMCRLVRLFRIFRATKVLVSFPELLILAEGMFEGLRSVLAVLWFLMLLIYVFGIVFTMTLRGTEVGSGVFDNVFCSMNSLLLQVLCGPDSDFIQSLLDTSFVYYALFLAFVLFANLTTMNMLIGILCDVVSGVAQNAKDDLFAVEIKHEVDNLAKCIDTDNDGTISKKEFDAFIIDPRVVSKFEQLSVDVVGVADFGKFVFSHVDTMTFHAFADLVSHFRGSQVTTRSDIINLRKYLSMELAHLDSRVLKLATLVNSGEMGVSSRSVYNSSRPC